MSSTLKETNKRSMRRFFYDAKPWSEKTFGLKKPSGPVGSLQHLKREVEEAIKKPKDLMEYADIMHLIFDATWRAGYTYDDLVNACYAKLAINKGRTWGKADAQGVVEHVEESKTGERYEEMLRELQKQEALEGVAAWEESSTKPAVDHPF